MCAGNLGTIYDEAKDNWEDGDAVSRLVSGQCSEKHQNEPEKHTKESETTTNVNVVTDRCQTSKSTNEQDQKYQDACQSVKPDDLNSKKLNQNNQTKELVDMKTLGATNDKKRAHSTVVSPNFEILVENNNRRSSFSGIEAVQKLKAKGIG